MKTFTAICKFSILLALGGCTAMTSLAPYSSTENIKERLVQEVEVNVSTKEDVRRILGEPQTISVYEKSSIENELSEIPVLDQITNTLGSNFNPDTTWTYIQPIPSHKTKKTRRQTVFGLNAYYKDVRIVNVFFNESNVVLGYNVTSHYVQ